MGDMEDQPPMVGASGKSGAGQEPRIWVQLGVSGARLRRRDASVGADCVRRPAADWRSDPPLAGAAHVARLHARSRQGAGLLGVRKP